MAQNNNQLAFLELLRAGLWENKSRLAPFGILDFNEIYRLAEEQSVSGLIAAGIENAIDYNISKESVIRFIGAALQIEQRNKSLNLFLERIINELTKNDVYALLIKGQGIAQCYERPLWRASGDIDLFLSKDNYQKGVKLLSALSSNSEEEQNYYQHIAFLIESVLVELHGTLRSGLWRRIDSVLDDVKDSILNKGRVRSWVNGQTQIFIPHENDNVVYVFTHILQHFLKEGIGLRQICDWCRLLWYYRETIDLKQLDSRIRRAGILSEWKTFAAFAVNYLGMPESVMPFYSKEIKWKRKAERVLDYILEAGNFGHNRDYSYYKKYPFLIYKAISLLRHLKDGFCLLKIYPVDSLLVTSRRLRVGIKAALTGKNHE